MEQVSEKQNANIIDIMQLQQISLFEEDPYSQQVSILQQTQQVIDNTLHLLDSEVLLYKHSFKINVESDSQQITGQFDSYVSNYRLILTKPKIQNMMILEQNTTNNTVPTSLPIGFMGEIEIIKKEIIIKLKTGIVIKLKPQLSQIQILHQAILKGCMNLPFYSQISLENEQSLSYDCLAQLQRMRINYNCFIFVQNPKGRYCPTYPKYFVIPKKVDSNLLEECLKIRNGRRVPIVSYYNYQYKTTLWRSAKLKVNQENNKFNLAYMRQISRDPLIIQLRDDEPTFRQRQSRSLSFKFMNNFALNSTFKRITVSYAKNQNVMKFLDKWFQDIQILLHCAYIAAQNLKQKEVILIQNFAYDRVPQVSALVQIIIDPYFRTITGFNLLLQKQFVSFGHPFGIRLGFSLQKVQEESPIFIEFLECVSQLINAHPDCFEFSVYYLARIAYEVFTTKFHNFYCQDDSSRTKQEPKLKAPNIWKHLSMKKQYYNYQWLESAALKQLNQVRKKAPSVKQFLVWHQLYDMLSQMRCEQPNQRRVKHRRSSLYKMIHQNISARTT